MYSWHCSWTSPVKIEVISSYSFFHPFCRLPCHFEWKLKLLQWLGWSYTVLLPPPLCHISSHLKCSIGPHWLAHCSSSPTVPLLPQSSYTWVFSLLDCSSLLISTHITPSLTLSTPYSNIMFSTSPSSTILSGILPALLHLGAHLALSITRLTY